MEQSDCFRIESTDTTYQYQCSVCERCRYTTELHKINVDGADDLVLIEYQYYTIIVLVLVV